jgi:hypothetical protein
MLPLGDFFSHEQAQQKKIEIIRAPAPRILFSSPPPPFTVVIDASAAAGCEESSPHGSTQDEHVRTGATSINGTGYHHIHFAHCKTL